MSLTKNNSDADVHMRKRSPTKYLK